MAGAMMGVMISGGDRMSEDAYFEMLEASDQRFEYWDGVVEGMAGASGEHCDIEAQIFGEIYKRLEGSGCSVLNGNQAVAIPARNSYLFADLTIVCGKKERQQRRGIACLLNPSCIVEVLSPSTAIRDEVDKFSAYTTIKSLREYVIVFADQYCVKLHERTHPDEIWKVLLFQDLDAEFELKSCGVRLQVRDVYGPDLRFGEQS